MNDVIHLLSEAVANQIAAGEVVQRPASAVKELLENAIDAGATSIQLIIKDAGRTLIQVVDDGKGMSFNDARLCFDRHATSKITSAEDLFALQTKGFRGEALASIAAIAHVELKTRRPEDEMGTRVVVEGSSVKCHEPTTAPVGTSFAIKNLFFNVPARRNFLKSDATEFANIVEELYRVALIYPAIAFTLYHNGKMVHQLISTHSKQRIVSIFGKPFNEKIFAIEQETDYMKISGFLGKPEHAKKKRGEQYLFINNRYVRHSGLNFAIESAYNLVVPEGVHPAYFISLQLDPATIDVNISPTKVEVKLREERLVFGFLHAAIKKAIGEFSLVPQLNFEYDTELDLDNVPRSGAVKLPTITVDPQYNPFQTHPLPSYGSQKRNTAAAVPEWENFWENINETTQSLNPTEQPTAELPLESTQDDTQLVEVEQYMIIQNRYLFAKMKDNCLCFDIIRAHERIIYDRYMLALKQTPIVVQQLLFPETIVLTPAKADLLLEIKPDLLRLGYDLEEMGGGQFAINGTPNNEEVGDLQLLMDNLIDEYQSNSLNYRTERFRNIASVLAKQQRSKMKPLAHKEEVVEWLTQLFKSMLPSISPSGDKVYEVITAELLENLLDHRK